MRVFTIKIQKFSSQVTLGDGLPELICTRCAQDSVNMYLFKLRCEESDKILRNRLGKSPFLELPHEHKPTVDNKDEIELHDVVIKPEIYSEESQINQDFHNDFDSFNAPDDSDLETYELFEEEKELKCPHCPLLFNKETEFSRHIKTHPVNKAYKCDTCDKRFSRNDLLIRHKIAHAMKINDEKFHFENFGEDTTDQDVDTIIIKTETALYPCTECSLFFIKKEELDTHLQNHAKDGKTISCKLCTKKFSKNAHLNRHMKIHLQNKPHVCPTCNKGFVRAEQLNNHMNIHSGIKPHVCAICLKGKKNEFLYIQVS